MLFTFTAILAFTAATQAQQAAPIITNNNLTDQYQAILTAGPGQIAGTFALQASTNGQGVLVAISANNFNLTDSREYTYHIHRYPVPANGSCNATGGHFDPYGVGDDHVCDPNAPQTCQLGDLSGKHGAITFGPEVTFAQLSTSYSDSYLSTTLGDMAFFGNLSIVVHRKSDKFRVNCGNLEPVHGSNTSTTTSGPTYANSTSTATSTVMGNSSMTNSASISTSTAVIAGTETAATVTPTVGGGANNGGNGAGPAITGTGVAAGFRVQIMTMFIAFGLALI